MLFIGFGMLYTLLKDHQWSSVALTVFMGAISIEFSLLCYFLWYKLFIENKWEKVVLNFDRLTNIDYFSTTVIITLGAVIGKLSISQYFVICIFEILFASLNFFLCYEKINFLDNGGSLFIHTFGGTFGVVLSVILFCRDNEFTSISNNPHLSNDYFSTVFSFIGTIFLWIFFPSFNVAKIQFKGNNNEKDFSEALRYRGIINTYLSMVGSLIGTFVFNPMIHNGKIKVEHLLNSSYVGGIIIGGCCTICTSGWASILIGFIGGSISVLCLWKIKSLFKKNKLEDTFGILNTFTIPGILGGFLTCIFIANLKDEPLRIYIFGKNFKEEANQAGLQVAAICVTLAIAGLSGIITGFVVYSIRCEKNEIYFVDSELFTEDENIPLPEWKYPRQNDSNLSSSGHKLDEQGREVQIDQV
jgi:ammonium transporter Rh